MTRSNRTAALVALLLAACAGEAGTAGSSGADGAPGATGGGGQPCTVTQNADGGATITCPDGTAVTVAAPGGCTIRDNGDGTKTVSCQDGTGAVISDGVSGVDATRTPGTVSGTVIDALGQPISGVTAALIGTPFSSTTGPDGLFRLLSVSAGVHELELSHPLFGTQPAGLVVVDSTETRLGALTLRGGALLAPGFVTSIDLPSRDGQRLLTTRAFHRSNGDELYRSEVVDLQGGGVVGGWLQESWLIAQWPGAELRGVVLAGWADPNIALCWLRWQDATTGASVELGIFDYSAAFVVRGERLYAQHMDWGGVRGPAVEIDLDTGVETALVDRTFWRGVAIGDLYRAPSTGELFFVPPAGGAEVPLGVSDRQVLEVHDGPVGSSYFWMAYSDGLGDPAIGRLDAQGGGLQRVVDDAATYPWGQIALQAFGDGSLYYFANRAPGAFGDAGDMMRLEGTSPPLLLCPGSLFGDVRLHSAGRVVACRLPPVMAGAPMVVSARRVADAFEIERHDESQPFEYASWDADWLFRFDRSVDPTTVEIVSVADASIRVVSTTANAWTWNGLGPVFFLTEQRPDGSLERVYVRATDLRRTVMPLDRDPLFVDAAGDALFTTSAAGFARWDLATGASVWSSPYVGPWSWFGRPPRSAELLMFTLSPQQPELWTLQALDLASGRRTAWMDPIGVYRLSADERTLWVAEAPLPSVDSGRAPGLYRLDLP